MSDQFDLFGTPEAPANPIEAAFWQYHTDNPRVYELFDRFTRHAIARGRKRFSAKVVMERIRWETSLETVSEEFKVNNSHVSYYARLWLRNNPEHGEFFRTRELRAGPISDNLKMEAA